MSDSVIICIIFLGFSLDLHRHFLRVIYKLNFKLGRRTSGCDTYIRFCGWGRFCNSMTSWGTSGVLFPNLVLRAVRTCLDPNFFFKLSTFPSHQNFPTHINLQLFHHIVPISTKLPILVWTKQTQFTLTTFKYIAEIWFIALIRSTGYFKHPTIKTDVIWLHRFWLFAELAAQLASNKNKK